MPDQNPNQNQENDFKVPEGFALIEQKQLSELIEQLKKKRTDFDLLKNAAHDQEVAFRKAVSVINFVQSLMPFNEKGEMDIDPMKLYGLISDKAKFAPIMKDLSDLKIYMEKYEKRTLQIIS